MTTDANTGSSFNRYAYASNNPYKNVDPDGRNPVLARLVYGAAFRAATWAGAGTLGSLIGIGIYDVIHSSSGPKKSDTAEAPKSDGKGDSKSGSNGADSNPYKGPVAEPVVVVDQHGNAIPVDQGQKINTSPNGDFQQVIGTDGKPTGDRIDRGGHPGQRDPSAQKPHGHRPGVTTPDGNPHLPIKPEVK